jgi:hypothetical protein
VLGRPSLPIETHLRLMFLKYRYRLGFEPLCREVADSISWQPTDSGLLAKGVAKMAKAITSLQDNGLATRTKTRDRTRMMRSGPAPSGPTFVGVAARQKRSLRSGNEKSWRAFGCSLRLRSRHCIVRWLPFPPGLCGVKFRGGKPLGPSMIVLASSPARPTSTIPTPKFL